VDAGCELMLEDALSILDGLWRMVRLAQDAPEVLDELNRSSRLSICSSSETSACNALSASRSSWVAPSTYSLITCAGYLT
jgi:hypothetical protein